MSERQDPGAPGTPDEGITTSDVPGYQRTQRLDPAELARAATDPSVAPEEPAPPAEPAAPEPQPDPEPPLHHDTAEIAARLPAPVRPSPPPDRTVEVIDLPVYRIRRPGDLVAAVVTTVGIALVLLLAVFAHATTEGVTEDVRGAIPGTLQSVLLAPVNLLEGVVTFLLPIVIGIERLFRRQLRLVAEAMAASLIAGLVTAGAVWLLNAVGPDVLVDGVATPGGVTLVPLIAALTAFLTIVAATDRRGLVAWTWNLLWVTLVLLVLRGGITLPGALASVLLGRTLGLVVRYVTGVLGDRAYGESLLRALRRAGIDPVAVTRVVDGKPMLDVEPTRITTDAPIGYRSESETASDAVERALAEVDEAEGHPAEESGRTAAEATAPPAPPAPPAPATTPAGPPTSAHTGRDPRTTATWELSEQDVERMRETAERPAVAGSTGSSMSNPFGSRRQGETPRPELRTASAVVGEDEGENRIYSVRDVDGRVWDVGVLDDDRQVLGALATFWRAVRLRGLQRRTGVSLRASVERASLLSYAAESAGVRTPKLRGIATEQGSAVLVSEHVTGSETFGDIQTRRLTDRVLDRIWEQVRIAHAAGLAHRELDDQAILIDAGDRVWLAGWIEGEIASPSLARRLDLTHVLALLALRVGSERAMASANRNLNQPQLASIAPILQPVALPERTRADARRNRAVLKEVQELLVRVIPTAADAPPMQLRRFSVRTIVTVTVAVVAVVILLTSINITQMIGFVREANPWWLAAAFVLGLSTYLGSAMTLKAFSPVTIPLWRTTLVQIAASVVALVAPAGVGPAALNLRFMQKQRLDTPMALATVALVQISQFVTTVLLLIVVALITGSSGALDQLPSGAVLIGALVVVVLVGSALAVTRLRRWVLAKITPTLKQIWPRLVWVVGQPGRLLIGLLGNVIMTVGYIAAFGLTLHAFGASIPLTTLAIVYLVSNTAGSAVPTPGGIGAVEGALTAGLTAAGVATAASLATAFVFRLLTFWGRVPLGWFALRYLQKRNLV
ncbi:lysylphosphatidylglycerol synthase transmembrane domain-containing protein [Serinibacter arcticus]|uniref:Integral membrane protein n=1 Tax=Serinibacter arcticus TaxID=1655435 RepID=A0A4Z1DXN2_9MICO|nr:lysylphosphatidylglycerol synthase transmembrane domain-containing protein [Serinibacter arcticus]TGO03830.1 integral membrane protein [Serinibacter arcticus]